MSEQPQAPKALRVTVNQVGTHGSWTNELPLQGGEVRFPDARESGGEIVVEVEPHFELDGTWQRSYDELERIAAKSEESGGYVTRSGPDGVVVIVGEDHLSGRDAFNFVQHLLRRSQAREAELLGVRGYDDARLEQAVEDAKREAREALEATIEEVLS